MCRCGIACGSSGSTALMLLFRPVYAVAMPETLAD
jgi:hypothetical protein